MINIIEDKCDYCGAYGSKGKLRKMHVNAEYRKLLMDPLYFHKNMPPSESSDWNDYLSEMGVKYFDPFFDTDYEDIITNALRNKNPIYFLGTNFELLDLDFSIEDIIEID